MNKSEILPWLFSGWRLPVLLITVLLIVGLIFWAYSGNSDGERPYIENTGISAGKNAIQSNLIANQEQVVNNAEQNANQANANLANSLRRDSNVFSGNSTDADDAFCRRYPADSSCDEWRMRQRR